MIGEVEMSGIFDSAAFRPASKSVHELRESAELSKDILRQVRSQSRPRRVDEF